jgi:effector-binding domain-containing protein
MKKILRFLLIFIIIIVAGFLILGLFAPKEVTVTRTVMINAPKHAVFEQITNFKNWTNWSPWYKMEPTVKMTYNGEDGQVGSSYHWVGEKTGEGEMKLASVAGDRADFDLTFIKPFKSTPKSYILAEDTAGMTKTTWGFHQHFGYPWNAMLLFMNMDEMLGKDFNNGLTNMKQHLEGNPSAAGGADIKEVEYAAHTFVGMRKTVGWNDLSKFAGETYGALGKALGSKINGVPVGIYYTWDTVKMNTDAMMGFPVSDTTTKIKGAVVTNVEASKAFMIAHKGGYASIPAGHMALNKYMAAKGKVPALILEEYVTMAPQEPDSNKWVTNIYYLVK